MFATLQVVSHNLRLVSRKGKIKHSQLRKVTRVEDLSCEIAMKGNNQLQTVIAWSLAVKENLMLMLQRHDYG